MSERYVAGERLWAEDDVEVVLARDQRIGREVALKRLTREPAPGDAQRFAREAEVQGRLEHRAVVPVLDVGVDGVGAPYLVMRHVRGTTLADALARRVKGDREAERRFPTRRLLTGFVDICGAVAYAREHGVVHGALRAEHVLLGDFGEVYVLEWGRAHTVEGPLDSDDIRSLGALLFSIVCLRPLDPGETDVHAAARAAERHVAPELLDACASALGGAASPGDLATAVRRWLDGVRDVRRRRELGARHRDRAAAALAAGDTAAAMREAGSALALDPGDAGAAEMVGRLMLTAPAEGAPEARAAIAASDTAELRIQAKTAALSFFAVPLFLPLFVICGIRDWGLFAMIFVFGAAESLMALAVVRGRFLRFWVPVSMIGSCVMMVLWSRVFGPMLLVPAMVAVLAMTAMTVPGLRPWWYAPILQLIPVLGVWGLEALGVFAPTTWYEDNALRITSHAIHLPATATALVLCAHAAITLTVAAHYMWQLTADNRDARRRLLLQSWYLEQIASVRVTARA